MVLDFDRFETAQGREPPGRAIEALDVVEHIRGRLVPRAVGPRGRARDRQRRETAFHGRAVPRIARPAHEAVHTALGHQVREGFTRALRSLIRTDTNISGFPLRQNNILHAAQPPTKSLWSMQRTYRFDGAEQVLDEGLFDQRQASLPHLLADRGARMACDDDHRSGPA